MCGIIIINNNNNISPLDLAGHQNQTDERGLSTSLLENEIFYSHMCRQNPGSRYLVSHVHNTFGTEDSYQFITPLQGEETSNRLALLDLFKFLAIS